jgi:hypothetical protein
MNLRNMHSPRLLNHQVVHVGFESLLSYARASNEGAKNSLSHDAMRLLMRVDSGPILGPFLAGGEFFLSQNFVGVQVGGNAVTMGKKKASSNVQTSKAAAKAAKKAKAAQKTERKEKRKLGKGKDELDDDQDLEAILENVSKRSPLLHHLV